MACVVECKWNKTNQSEQLPCIGHIISYLKDGMQVTQPQIKMQLLNKQ